MNPKPDAGDPRASPYRSDGDSVAFFRLGFHFDPSYPVNPPEVVFRTKVWHPQVDHETGKVCADYLKTQWKGASSTIFDILIAFRTLLAAPSADGAVNTEALSQFQTDLDAFERKAREWTVSYAMDSGGDE